MQKCNRNSPCPSVSSCYIGKIMQIGICNMTMQITGKSHKKLLKNFDTFKNEGKLFCKFAKSFLEDPV